MPATYECVPLRGKNSACCCSNIGTCARSPIIVPACRDSERTREYVGPPITLSCSDTSANETRPPVSSEMCAACGWQSCACSDTEHATVTCRAGRGDTFTGNPGGMYVRIHHKGASFRRKIKYLAAFFFLRICAVSGKLLLVLVR